MDPWTDLRFWHERSEVLLREAEQRRLARELWEARRARRIVRWGLPGDEHKVAELLELNGRPRWEAFEERFIVAEEKGKILAALPYQTTSKRLWVGPLITDPWVEERPLARALYAGLGDLAREIGVDYVLTQPLPYADYPRETGTSGAAAGGCMLLGPPAAANFQLAVGVGWLLYCAEPFAAKLRSDTVVC